MVCVTYILFLHLFHYVYIGVLGRWVSLGYLIGIESYGLYFLHTKIYFFFTEMNHSVMRITSGTIQNGNASVSSFLTVD